MNPEENDEIMENEVDVAETDTDEIIGDVPTIIDLVMDGKASEAKEAIYASLYQKVGERIDAIKPEIRGAINTTQEPQEQE
jgi:hypothetical protein